MGRCANFLDDGDLLIRRDGLEDHVERALGFFGRGGGTCTRARDHDRATRGGFDTVGFLEVCGNVNRLLQREASELITQCLQIICDFCHDYSLRIVS